MVARLPSSRASGRPRRTRRWLLAYFYEPQWFFDEMDLQRVELPPYEEGCDADAAKVDCDYPPYALNKLISTKFADSGSPAVDLIKNFKWTNEDQNLVSKYIAEDGMDPDDAAAEVDRRRTRTRSTPGSSDRPT